MIKKEKKNKKYRVPIEIDPPVRRCDWYECKHNNEGQCCKKKCILE